MWLHSGAKLQCYPAKWTQPRWVAIRYPCVLHDYLPKIRLREDDIKSETEVGTVF